MNSADYTPGPPITTPELLRDVIRCEDAVYYKGLVWTTAEVRRAMQVTGMDAQDLASRGTFRRAWLKCPPAATERTET